MESPPAIQTLFPLVNRRFQSFAEAADSSLDVLARALPGTVVIGQLDPGDGLCRVLDVRGVPSSFARGDLLPQRENGGAELDLDWLAGHGLPGCISLPLEMSDGSFVGVVCALCDDEGVYATDHVILLGLVARLLSYEWERVHTGAELRQLRRSLSSGSVDRDTGLADRAGFVARLERDWRLARRGTVQSVVLACEIQVEAERPAAQVAATRTAVKLAAEVISAVARNTDHVARTQPLFLAVAMAGTDDATGAHALIDRYTEALRRVTRERHAEISVACGFHPLGDAGSAEQALALAESSASEAAPIAITAEVGLL